MVMALRSTFYSTQTDPWTERQTHTHTHVRSLTSSARSQDEGSDEHDWHVRTDQGSDVHSETKKKGAGFIVQGAECTWVQIRALSMLL